MHLVRGVSTPQCGPYFLHGTFSLSEEFVDRSDVKTCLDAELFQLEQLLAELGKKYQPAWLKVEHSGGLTLEQLVAGTGNGNGNGKPKK